MPIYEYVCRSCDHRWEVLQRNLSQALPACPVCGQMAAEKMPSAAVMVGRHASGGGTCCGREERCAAPPCGSGGCHRA